MPKAHLDAGMIPNPHDASGKQPVGRTDSPERSSGRLSDIQALVQQHGPQAPHSVPLEETWDGLALLHHPGNAGTCKLPNICTGTLQLDGNKHTKNITPTI